ncbi:glycosyltransferase 87 family protein [Actinoplanes sp. CA-051413]|uniref:glycosyltransferase 87 family protein n=1 Tax=Actinoplanes sp. CA-051413 TaxID=3239899 RepID=UPI003D99936D
MPAMRTAARPATTRCLVVLLAWVGILAAITTIAQRYGFSDLAVDRAAIMHALAGDGLYAYRSPLTHLGTALPPPALFVVSPAVFLPLPLAGWLTALAGVAALGLSMIALVSPVARRYGRRPWPVVLAASALALTIEPVRAALGLGTLDLLAFGLVTADIVALRRSAWARSRAAWWPGRPASSPPRGRTPGDLLRRGWSTGAWAGLGVGLATALAVTPAFFIVYLAVTRQWRAALTATGTALSAALAAWLISPRETAAWLGEVLWRIDRTGPVDAIANQSLAGVLARIYDSATAPVLLWLSFSLLLIAVGLIRARAAHADGDEIAAFTLVGLTVAIVGPVTDTHELIWILPAVLILIDAAARRRVTSQRRPPGRRPGMTFAVAAGMTYLLFVLAPMWSLRDSFSDNSYALALILLVNALPWRPGVAPAFPINRWLGRVSPGARRKPASADLGGGGGGRSAAGSPGLVRRVGPASNRPGGPLPATAIPPPRDPGR